MTCTLKIASAALAACLILAPGAVAQVAVTTSISVPYNDLDISKPAGGASLLKRIESAARHVCGSASAYNPLMMQITNKCRRDAVADAVREAGIGTLTLAWSGNSPAAMLASR